MTAKLPQAIGPLQRVLDAMPPPALANGDRYIRVSSLALVLGQHRGTMAKRLGRLVKAGLVERRRPGCYALTKMGCRVRAAGSMPPALADNPAKCKPRYQQGGLVERLWAALRRMRKATLAQLVEIAARPGERGLANASQIVRVWKIYGLVAVLGADTARGPKPARYLLLRDLGIKAPRPADRYTRLFDPNAGVYLPRPENAVPKGAA
jgi:hypothetical protein